MPLYEYRCKNCRRRVTILVQKSSTHPPCPECGGSELERLFSSFRVARTDQGIYDDILSDNQLVRGLMHNDPRALAEWNKRMSAGTGDKVAPEYEEMLERMEAGEPPPPPPQSPAEPPEHPEK